MLALQTECHVTFVSPDIAGFSRHFVTVDGNAHLLVCACVSSCLWRNTTALNSFSGTVCVCSRGTGGSGTSLSLVAELFN